MSYAGKTEFCPAGEPDRESLIKQVKRLKAELRHAKEISEGWRMALAASEVTIARLTRERNEARGVPRHRAPDAEDADDGDAHGVWCDGTVEGAPV